MTYALVVVLLFFLAAVSRGLSLPYGARTRRFRTHGNHRDVKATSIAVRKSFLCLRCSW
jgi:hypothetical protein